MTSDCQVGKLIDEPPILHACAEVFVKCVAA